MRTIPLLVLSLLLSLAEEVYCQIPHVSFMGQTLANHSYVNLSTVGSASDNSDSLVCHTDLQSCCYGHHPVLPWWRDRLPFTIREGRRIQRVVLRRASGVTGPTGIYRCDIAAVAVHNETDISVRDTVCGTV